MKEKQNKFINACQLHKKSNHLKTTNNKQNIWKKKKKAKILSLSLSYPCVTAFDVNILERPDISFKIIEYNCDCASVIPT